MLFPFLFFATVCSVHAFVLFRKWIRLDLNPFKKSPDVFTHEQITDKGVKRALRTTLGTLYSTYKGQLKKAVEEVYEATGNIDTRKKTKKNPKWHFDAERIQDGHENIQHHFQLVLNRTRDGNYEKAGKLLGRALHPLQDFYSHTNWVEMGNKKPNYNIGIPDRELGATVAGPNEPTCRDCGKKKKKSWFDFILKIVSKIADKLGLTLGDYYHKKCRHNVITHTLTSGYSVNQKDDQGQPVKKPENVTKCSHGGLLDGSSSHAALGGINKDAPVDKLSPHHRLHEEAARLAQDATEYWVGEVLKQLHRGQVLRLFGVSAEDVRKEGVDNY